MTTHDSPRLRSAIAALLLAVSVCTAVPPVVFAAIPPPTGPGLPVGSEAAPSTEILPEEGVPLAGPGAGETAAAGASCAASAAGYIPFVNAIVSLFSTSAPVRDNSTVLGLVANCALATLNLVKNTITAVNSTITSGGIAYLVAKSKADVIAVGLLKSAIQVARDMVNRWILTGRFDGPVFSKSFAIDASQAAENASRIFLSQITSINFCEGFDIPSVLAFPFDLRLRLSCTLPYGLRSRSDTLQFFLHPERYSDEDRLLALQPENLYPWALTYAIEAKAEAEAKAVITYAAEYTAGSGFLPIKDKNGNVTTPGQAVAQIVMDQEIRGPREEATVAQTVQQAIGSIIDTAIRAALERGLGAAFKK